MILSLQDALDLLVQANSVGERARRTKSIEVESKLSSAFASAALIIHHRGAHSEG